MVETYEESMEWKSGSSEDLLRQGIAAARAGQRERARELLTRLVEQDEENALAWLWLSGVVDSLEDREVCLENVLTLDPDNTAARRGLDLLHRQKVEQLLREGIAAAKAGQRERACEILTRVVAHDEKNISAWLWLSGVVDSLEDREICLENVLSLDPENDAARRGLAVLRKQREAPSPPSADPGPSSTSASDSPVPERADVPISPAAAILDEDSKSYRPELESEPPPSPVQAEFENEYLCPYCATPTEPADRRCEACGGELWIRFRKQEKRSTWLWMAIVFQFLNTLRIGIIPAALSVIVFWSDNREVSRLIDAYAEIFHVARSDIETSADIAFVITLVMFLFSLAVLISLYLRWKPAYYLLMVTASLGAFGAAVGIILSLSPSPAPQSPVVALLAGGGNLLCNGFNFAIALAVLWAVFQMQDDFAFERRRVLFRPDPDIRDSSTFLARGHDYARRKMWGLAALHMRRSVALMPDRMDGRGALILIYLKLKRYDLAEQALAEARRINPQDPQIAELQALLDSARSAEGSE